MHTAYLNCPEGHQQLVRIKRIKDLDNAERSQHMCPVPECTATASLKPTKPGWHRLRDLIAEVEKTESQALNEELNRIELERGTDPRQIKSVRKRYRKILKQLRKLPKHKPYKLTFVVQKNRIPETDNYEACLYNPNSALPPKGKKPTWSKKPKPGCYSFQEMRGITFTSIIGIPWKKLIDTPINNHENLPAATVLAEILVELTNGGCTEKQIKKQSKKLSKLIREALDKLEETQKYEC